MTRRLIVVDLETTGLHAGAVILEVAAVNVQTGESLHFVPEYPRYVLSQADPEALAINRYFERRLYRDSLTTEDTTAAYVKLGAMLTGNTFGGSNPTFDSALIERELHDKPWHYRLADLAAYAAGRLGLPLTELPGLQAVCDVLGVINKEPHSAMGDAQATADCFGILMEHE